VFDYERTRDYRLFIAGEDKNIYAFSKEGERVKDGSLKGQKICLCAFTTCDNRYQRLSDCCG
jgi:hypothetical protein